MWVQFIHDRNVANTARGTPVETLPEALEAAFGYLRGVPL
jgi:hypothetical protein